MICTKSRGIVEHIVKDVSEETKHLQCTRQGVPKVCSADTFGTVSSQGICGCNSAMDTSNFIYFLEKGIMFC